MPITPKLPVFLSLMLTPSAEYEPQAGDGWLGVFTIQGRLVHAWLQDRQTLAAAVEASELLWEVKQVDVPFAPDYTTLYQYPALQEHIRRINQFNRLHGPPL